MFVHSILFLHCTFIITEFIYNLQYCWSRLRCSGACGYEVCGADIIYKQYKGMCVHEIILFYEYGKYSYEDRMKKLVAACFKVKE